VGQTEYTAWAVVTSEGIIVIEPLVDYAVEDEVHAGTYAGDDLHVWTQCRRS
jgi:hypothetical protein